MMFAQQAAKRAHQRHIGDDIGHFAVHCCGLAGEVVMQRPAGRGQPEHQANHDAGNTGEAGCHRHTDRAHQCNRCDRRYARRQHVPDKHVLASENSVRSCSYAARQRTGQPFSEITRGVPGEVPKQVAPQVAGHTDKGEIRNPTGDAPQQVIGGDQRTEQNKCCPYVGGHPMGKRVDQILDAVLRADRTPYRREDRGQDRCVGDWALPHIAKDKNKRTIGVLAKVGHARSISAL